MSSAFTLPIIALCCAIAAGAIALICAALRKRAGGIVTSALSVAFAILALVLLPIGSQSAPPDFSPDELAALCDEIEYAAPDGSEIHTFYLNFHARSFQGFGFSTLREDGGVTTKSSYQLNYAGQRFSSEGVQDDETLLARRISRETLRALLLELDDCNWRQFLPLKGSWDLTVSVSPAADVSALGAMNYTYILRDGALTPAEALPENTRWHIIWMQSGEQIIRILYEVN